MIGVTSDRLAATALDEICELEARLLDPALRAERAEVEALLHPEFVEFGSSGVVWSRAATVDGLAANPGARVEALGMVAHQLAVGVVLVTYESRRSATRVLRSSLWVRASDRWQLRFHQGTLMAGD